MSENGAGHKTFEMFREFYGLVLLSTVSLKILELGTNTKLQTLANQSNEPKKKRILRRQLPVHMYSVHSDGCSEWKRIAYLPMYIYGV